MTLLYDRRIKVQVAGLTVEDLRVALEIEREADATQNTGTVSIFNLAPENEERVYKRADEIRVSAGYPETIALIYDGHVERVQRMREQLARRTVIKLGDTVRRSGRENPRLGGIYSATLAGPVRIREIVRGIAKAMELPLGPLDAIPEDATWTDWAFSGPAAAAMSAALRRVGCTWFEDNGKIRINRPRPAGGGAELQADAPTIVLSPESGLIDRPIETDEGAEANMLLNPAVVIGCRIDLESDSLSGSWKVVALKHTGDNWRGGPFRTWVELRALGADQPAPG